MTNTGNANLFVNTAETHIRGAFAKLGIPAAPEDNPRVLAVLVYLRR